MLFAENGNCILKTILRHPIRFSEKKIWQYTNAFSIWILRITKAPSVHSIYLCKFLFSVVCSGSVITNQLWCFLLVWEERHKSGWRPGCCNANQFPYNTVPVFFSWFYFFCQSFTSKCCLIINFILLSTSVNHYMYLLS